MEPKRTVHPARDVHRSRSRPGVACWMVNLSARQRLNGKDSQPCLTARNENATVAKQRGSVTRPCVNHARGTYPSVRFRIEELAIRAGDSIDTCTTGDQYAAIVQKGRGVRDVSVEKIGTSRPCTSVDCLGLTAQRARSSEPAQYSNHEDAPKHRLHGSLATAALPQEFHWARKDRMFIRSFFLRRLLRCRRRISPQSAYA